MATHHPNLVVHVVNSSNQILGANGTADTSFTREPTATIQFVSSTGKIIDTDFTESAFTGRLPMGAAVIVDSSNRIIGSDGSAGAFRQSSIAVRQVGPGVLASLVMRVVDGSNTVLDGIFGGGATAPDAPTITLTSGASDLTPEFTFVASINLVEDDILRFYDQTLGLLTSHTVTALEAAGATIYMDVPALTPRAYIFYATHARNGAESDASNTQSITLTSGTPGTPIGLLLALTKAA
jgi:hypothetical protein